jgi:hypothetical protein
MRKQDILPRCGSSASRTRPKMTATMREQEPIRVMPASKLGEYTVVQEIAEGTFGKVKSMYNRQILNPSAPNHNHFASGRTHPHGSQGRNEVHLKACYQHDTYKKPCSTRGRIHAYSPSCPHNQAVRPLRNRLFPYLTISLLLAMKSSQHRLISLLSSNMQAASFSTTSSQMAACPNIKRDAFFNSSFRGSSTLIVSRSSIVT